METYEDSQEEKRKTFVDVPVRVRYTDTDKMGIVYYGTYPVYFEIGRSEFMREKGFTYREFEENGFHLVVVSLEARYYNTATYDDLLTVRTTVSDLKSRGLTFHYEVLKGDTLLVKGNTRHICVNAENKKSVSIPLHLFAILKDVCTQ